MSDCRTYDNVTEEIFDCVKKKSYDEHDTVYEPSSGLVGTATTKTIVGTVKLSFDLKPDEKTITYCIVEKPGLVPASEVFRGIADSIESCRSSQESP